MRSACGYGSGRRSSAFVTLKIALFAPMPIASERTATAVKPRDLASTRNPCRTSCRQLSSETVRSGMSIGIKTGRACFGLFRVNRPFRLLALSLRIPCSHAG